MRIGENKLGKMGHYDEKWRGRVEEERHTGRYVT